MREAPDIMNIFHNTLEGQEQPDGQQEPLQEFDVYVQPDIGRMTFILKDQGAEQQPPPKYTHRVSSFFLFLGYIVLSWALVLIPSSVATAALPTVTITIVPRSQEVSLTTIIQTGRVLDPITLTQEKTIATTGHGHTLATQAQGYLTFYNGSFYQKIIAKNSLFTGADGIQVTTDHAITIPPGNPSTGYGKATVTAHAVNEGIAGNIQAEDINTTLSSDLLVRNLEAFTDGKNERYFSTVSPQDVHKISTQLTATLTQSMNGALESQLQPGEKLVTLPCTPNVTPTPPAGAEATSVHVSVSLTCSAIAYNVRTVADLMTQALTTQAIRSVGTGYTLRGTPQITVLHASVAQHPTCVLTLSVTGTFSYTLTTQEQQRLIHLIAGKGQREALQLLERQPGIQRVSITNSTGDELLPQDTRNIHLIVS